MTSREKFKMVKDFFIFNVTVMTPQALRIGWWQFSNGVRFMWVGLTMPLRGLFATRKLLAAAEQEASDRERALIEPPVDEVSADTNAN